MDNVKASPQRLIKILTLKVDKTVGDISKIPKTISTNVQKEFLNRKEAITSAIDNNLNSVKSTVSSAIPSDTKDSDL